MYNKPRRFSELPNIDHWTADILAKAFKEDQLCTAIQYLEKVLREAETCEEIIPDPEIAALGIDVLEDTTIWEILAVKNRLMLAVKKIQACTQSKSIRMTGNVGAQIARAGKFR